MAGPDPIEQFVENIPHGRDPIARPVIKLPG